MSQQMFVQDDAPLQPESGSRNLLSVSSLVDGDLTEDGLTTLLGHWDSDAECLQAWHRYHLIGEVMRDHDAGLGCSVQAATSQGSAAFAQSVMAAVQASRPTAIDVPQPLSAQQLKADSDLLVSTVPVVSSPTVSAANDSVFRWKMVAGVASLAAVLSVAWNVSGQSGAQANMLAARTPTAQIVAAAPVAQPVLVNTPQGAVLRDARLEELMQAHRLTGSASALQVPAGFLRSATFDASQR